jgi:hypothetical protein
MMFNRTLHVRQWLMHVPFCGCVGFLATSETQIMIETADFFCMPILHILIYTCYDSTAFNLYRRRRVIWVRSGTPN